MAKRILLIEDEDPIRQMYSFILSKQGYQVVEAIDGEDALVKLKEPGNSFDVVLLDIMLPKVDGIEVLKQMKAAGSPAKDIPVFVLTNLAQDDLIEQAKNLGANDYWVKADLFPTDLITKLEKFFGT